MKKLIALTIATLSLMPMSAFAAPKHKMAVTTYQCVKCHMKYDAATAKKDHFKDPMDGGKLVPVKAAVASKKSMTAKPMGGMKM